MNMKNTNIKNIMIVDDEPENLQIISSFFSESKLPYNITNAPNGIIALKIMKKKLPDLIITDWEMPGMDGIELIEKLKDDDKTSSIPVIMCTGVMTSSKNLDTALNAGAVDFIRKPIDKIELIARTKANLHLADSYIKIKKLNATKDKFFSIIAHDLMSPFNSMLGFSDLLIEDFESYQIQTQKEYIGIINQSIKNTYKLLENLLTWSRLQKDIIDFNPEKINLLLIFKETCELLKQSAENKSIKLTNNISENIFINADKNMISTVLRNIITNAIKFTPKGGKIWIDAKNKQQFIEITTQDSGVGISKEKQSELFKIDQNTSTQGTERETGTGLGLILCKEFTEKHGGKIWVESEEGKGSTFIFTIPKTANRS